MDSDEMEVMTIEQMIGRRIQDLRQQIDDGSTSQAEIGRRLGSYLPKPWARQSVSHAEAGNRAFTAVELIALSRVFDIPVADLLTPPPGVRVEFPSGKEWGAPTKATNELAALSDLAQAIESIALQSRQNHAMAQSMSDGSTRILALTDAAYAGALRLAETAKPVDDKRASEIRRKLAQS